MRLIDNEILMFMRKNKRYVDFDSFSKTIKISKNSDEMKLEDILEDERINVCLDYEKKEEIMELRNLVELLPN